MGEQKGVGIGMAVVRAGAYYEIRNDNGTMLANFADLMDAEICMLALAQARIAAIDECVEVCCEYCCGDKHLEKMLTELEALKEKPE